VLAVGLVCVVAAVVCTWVFLAAQARADSRAGGTARLSRPSRRWLWTALVLAPVGVGLVAVHVGSLWLP
jgi:hypothetical protein